MTQRRLALLLAVFFVALALPTTVLVYQAYGQLKWEALHQHQRLARDLTQRIDAGFRRLIEREEIRPISDYEFLNVAGGDGSAFLQRSPLSNLPQQTDFPGLLGYFQVDSAGQLHTPIVPEANAENYGISSNELVQRELQQGRIRDILDQNRLVSKKDQVAVSSAATLEAVTLEEDAKTESLFDDEARVDDPNLISKLKSVGKSFDSADYGAAEGQAAFDELASRRQAAADAAPVAQLEELDIEDNFRIAAKAPPQATPADMPKAIEPKRARKEKFTLPQAAAETAVEPPQRLDRVDADGVPVAPPAKQLNQQAIRIETFESEVEPMEFALLDSGHFVLFRRVWHQDERYVQGVLIDQDRFLAQLIEAAFRQSTLSSMSRLIVAYQGGILRDLSAAYSRLYQPGTRAASNELLYQSRLIAPFGDFELIYTLARLPLGAGGKIIVWSALILTLVLIAGFILLYQLGRRQLALARQQQDFVSAVSHELKTPLTSIRMYGEMLREGWADEAKRKTYYDFIFHEAERLTRLINNVLQLARLSRSDQHASLQPIGVGAALAELRPRLESQLEASGFELFVDGDAAADRLQINIDSDWFIQIFINLVDNAVKFSVGAAHKRVDLRYRKLRDGRIQFAVRDHGPGIAADQMKKIFKLFYRSENELTRETVGTGIGLALVQQLASAMAAEIDVVNRDPGAEFQLRFSVA